MSETIHVNEQDEVADVNNSGAHSVTRSAQAPTRYLRAEELEKSRVAPPAYMVDTLIPRGRLILGVGDSTQGKTPFALQLARDVAGGLDFLDYFKHRNTPSRVALIDAESPKEDIACRLRMQGGGRPVKTEANLLVLGIDEVLGCRFDVTEKGLATMRDFVYEEKIDFLILDNLWALSAGKDITKGNEAQPILMGMRRITRLPHSPTVCFLHHPRKGDRHDLPDIAQTDFARWAEEASGSRILFNLTDVRFGLQRVETRGEEYTIFRGRTRVPGGDQDFGPLYLAIDEEHSLAQIDKRPIVLERLGDKERQILTCLRNSKQFDVKEARRLMRGDVCDKTIRRAFRHAHEHGLILKTPISGLYEWTADTPRDVVSKT